MQTGVAMTQACSCRSAWKADFCSLLLPLPLDHSSLVFMICSTRNMSVKAKIGPRISLWKFEKLMKTQNHKPLPISEASSVCLKLQARVPRSSRVPALMGLTRGQSVHNIISTALQVLEMSLDRAPKRRWALSMIGAVLLQASRGEFLTLTWLS